MAARVKESTMLKLPLCTILVSFFLAPVAFAAPDDELAALLDDHWEWTLEAFPEQASRLGDKRYAENWTDRSRAAAASRQEARREFLQRLYTIPRAELSASGQLNYELFRRELTREADLFKYGGDLMPFSQRGGVQNLESLANLLSFESTDDYDDWLARMNKVGDVVDQTIAAANAGIDRGLTSPAVLMQRIPAQIDKQLVDRAEDSPFYAVFSDIPESTPERDRLQRDARSVIEQRIVPAYRKLKRYMEGTYLPAARESVGLAALPDGKDWYARLAREFTTTSMTPDEIHRLGLQEVRRIRDAMQEIIDEVGFDGDFDAFLNFLRTDPQFYYDDPDALYTAYLATSKRIDPELVRLFGKLPRTPYGVKPIPDAIAPDTTTAYYSAPASDGTRAGTYWVNLYKPEVRPIYEIEVLSVHEAMPGHHLQIALQQELGEMPNFRRFTFITAFVEGWGLYSESLGYELGLYKDPYSRFGQLTYDMWRAVRLVVDTGLHDKGWTREQAIDFFRRNAAKTEHDIVNEIDRYIGNPGQALAYKVGQLKIQELRETAERTLGKRFDIRAFHDELLGAGALPLDLLETRMDRWLTRELQRVSAGAG